MLFLQQRDKNRAELLEFLNSTYWRKQGSELHSQNSPGRVKGQDPPPCDQSPKVLRERPVFYCRSVCDECKGSQKHWIIGCPSPLYGWRHDNCGAVNCLSSSHNTTQHNTVLVCLTCQGTKHASYRLGLSPKVICNRSCLKIKTFVNLFYCFRE